MYIRGIYLFGGNTKILNFDGKFYNGTEIWYATESLISALRDGNCRRIGNVFNDEFSIITE